MCQDNFLVLTMILGASFYSHIQPTSKGVETQPGYTDFPQPVANGGAKTQIPLIPATAIVIPNSTPRAVGFLALEPMQIWHGKDLGWEGAHPDAGDGESQRLQEASLTLCRSHSTG